MTQVTRLQFGRPYLRSERYVLGIIVQLGKIIRVGARGSEVSKLANEMLGQSRGFGESVQVFFECYGEARLAMLGWCPK